MSSEKEYMDLLERAYRIVTPKAQRRAEIPKLEVQNLPRRTVVANLGQIAKRLNRDPTHIAKFFQKELATPGMIDGDALILTGERTQKVVEAVYERYLKFYVICPVCGSIDTVLQKEERIYVLRCTACGAVTPVKPL
ncbi:MAG: translation initiation factor IF-2 subunit beta [Thermoproteus sp.]|jgi:translation initiation factor 2 subunit 2|uniref:translation initiation factor IF-2 subunit beta n=1 Tax=Thermoproteus sp. CP80 TaxID=1650659 RepID=UPI0009C109EE|nr:translation initiation factor IF-2 subunit beta [Thermoproteus sp. CP80]MCI4464565.1 translation initiation factor IF-2 subunit beta [Thermoproteus sp.]MDT7869807.1 translation initiation factor IF-2 subunit beta [Thermoproteus sp.]MDT7882272.1 translation initiation factor IF-2 subunit beta [Thermoproteus sp.]PLC67357.1 translation initiation factor IF-2 subunit beta [Thermoproteus sp. CP80]